MKSLILVAAAALVSTTMLAPASARYCDHHRCYHRGPVDAAADTAGGVAGAAIGTAGAVAGAAIGTAGAIATAPFQPYRSSYGYDYYSDPNNGFVCRPGTWFKGADGRPHPCQ